MIPARCIHSLFFKVLFYKSQISDDQSAGERRQNTKSTDNEKSLHAHQTFFQPHVIQTLSWAQYVIQFVPQHKDRQWMGFLMPRMGNTAALPPGFITQQAAFVKEPLKWPRWELRSSVMCWIDAWTHFGIKTNVNLFIEAKKHVCTSDVLPQLNLGGIATHTGCSINAFPVISHPQQSCRHYLYTPELEYKQLCQLGTFYHNRRSVVQPMHQLLGLYTLAESSCTRV